MIVVTLTYKKPLAEVDAVLKEHIAFLDHYYEQRNFWHRDVEKIE